MSKKVKNFEQAIERLEEITGLLENPETTLEKSMELYKEGIELSTVCSEKLKSCKSEIVTLTKALDGSFVENEFSIEDDHGL